MRLGFLLLCFYGLSSAAHASTLSMEDLSPDTHIYRSSPLSRLTRGDLSGPGIIGLKHRSAIDAHRSLISSARSIKINPGTDITVSANSPLVTTGNITLLSGGNISLSDLAKKDIRSATLTPRLSGGDITIWRAGNIDAGRGSLTFKEFTILPGENISFGSGIRVPPISTISISGGKIVLAHRGDVVTTSGVSVASVPLPASFYMLMTGLLTLVSVSKRTLFGKA